ncbi:hypothetical protein MMC13_008514 [Lambiella insularis]|nr:hypothetical protein [Lambiella insularis]
MSRPTAYTFVPRVAVQDEDAQDGFAGDIGAPYDDHDTSARRLSTSSNINQNLISSHSSSTLPSEYAPYHEKSDGASMFTTETYDTTLRKNHINLARQFLPRKQILRLLLWGLARFIITGVLVGGLYVTLWTFEAKSVLSEVQKKIFNTIITALSLALGINIASSFKNVAIDTRWWFLSRKRRPLKEIDMILNNNSLTTLSELAAGSIKRPTIMLVCLLWITINIAAQAGVAMLGLTYSMNPSADPAEPVLAQISITNMSRYYFGQAETQLSADQFSAHMYGEMSLNLFYDNIPEDQPIISPVEPLTLFSDLNVAYWVAPEYAQHVFLEMPAESIFSGAFYSNRTIIGSTNCTAYPVTQGYNGDSQTIYYTKNNRMAVANFEMIEPKSTTYYTSPQLGDCGPRCANVCAFENNGDQGFYYECEIAISNVTNATLPEHQVSDTIAKIAAGSIALQGYQAINLTDQYQRYPTGFECGIWQNGNAAGMAAIMTQFAIGSISAADLNNPVLNETRDSLVPGQGVQLTLDHPNSIHAILITICAVHLVLFVAGALLANRVVVIDDSYLAIARLLRPIVEKLGDEGGLLDGDEICEALGENMQVVYGSTPKTTADGVVRHLQISDMRPTKDFPAGLYN